MAGTQDPLKEFGIEIPPEERTPLVEQLLEMIRHLDQENQKLREEIDRLKGLPETPQRREQPSSLHDPQKPSDRRRKKKRKRPKRGQRPGSAKRSQNSTLPVTEVISLETEGLPEGTQPAGYKPFRIQELHLEARHIEYRRRRYKLPDGTHHVTPRPPELRGQFGPNLRAYVLYQYYQNHVTQPLILEQLRDLGLDISVGQIDAMLTTGHEEFHREKDALLPAAREVSPYFQTDDTPARHQGAGGHTTHLGNELFASFTTSMTKSRANFLKILCAPYEEYVLSGDALYYMRQQGLSQRLVRFLEGRLGEEAIWSYDEAGWQRALSAWGITGEEHRRIATEGALFGCLMNHGLYLHQPLLSDDAGQFKVLGFLHGLCWLHAERHLARLAPAGARQRKAQERTQDALWHYYRRLQDYRHAPTSGRKKRLERDFNRLCLEPTGWPELNDVLHRLHARKENLLLVLKRPEIPLHNNLSENDIREWAKKRKISAGTRSELGRRCRDTFLSLKKTCRKLGVPFWRYLQDRIYGTGTIPPLGELIRRKAMHPG